MTILKRKATDPAFEGVGKGKRTGTVNLLCNLCDWFIGCHQSFGCPVHAQVSHVLHGGAAKRKRAKSAQMFFAHIRELCKLIERPVIRQMTFDLIPDVNQTGVFAKRFREHTKIVMDDVSPF